MRFLRQTLQGLIHLLAVLSFSCGGPALLDRTPHEQHHSADDYQRVLSNWTRKTTLLSVGEMDNVLTATATYESSDFRHAYAARYRRDYSLAELESERLLDRSLAEAQEYHEFYVALYAQHHDWALLDSDETAWFVRLVDNHGRSTKPSAMRQIKKPGALELTYYPYTTSFRSVYRISFPTKDREGRATIGDTIQWFGLQFSGPQGTATIKWKTL